MLGPATHVYVDADSSRPPQEPGLPTLLSLSSADRNDLVSLLASKPAVRNILSERRLRGLHRYSPGENVQPGARSSGASPKKLIEAAILSYSRNGLTYGRASERTSGKPFERIGRSTGRLSGGRDA